jgi:hypothetical protein
MAPTKKSRATKSTKSISARLALVVKSGKYTLGYKFALKQMRNGKGELLFRIYHRCTSSLISITLLCTSTVHASTGDVPNPGELTTSLAAIQLTTSLEAIHQSLTPVGLFPSQNKIHGGDGLDSGLPEGTVRIIPFRESYKIFTAGPYYPVYPRL